MIAACWVMSVFILGMALMDVWVHIPTRADGHPWSRAFIAAALAAAGWYLR
jgi:hypothetical protein